MLGGTVQYRNVKYSYGQIGYMRAAKNRQDNQLKTLSMHGTMWTCLLVSDRLTDMHAI